MARAEDIRRQRTRQALVNAYGELVLSGRQGPIRVADIVERAEVGRSTFYEHFSNADELRMQAIAAPLSAMSAALAGHDEAGLGLVHLLQHFQDHRQHAIEALDGRQRRLAVRVVSGQLDEHCQAAGVDVDPLDIQQVAEGALALCHAWLRGEVRNSREELAAAMIRAARAVLGPPAESP